MPRLARRSPAVAAPVIAGSPRNGPGGGVRRAAARTSRSCRPARRCPGPPSRPRPSAGAPLPCPQVFRQAGHSEAARLARRTHIPATRRSRAARPIQAATLFQATLSPARLPVPATRATRARQCRRNPAPAGRGRRAAADLTSETIAYRAPNGGTTGRHSHRAGQDQAGRGPATEPGRRPPDSGPPTDGPGRGAGPGYDTGPGYAAGPGRDATGPGYDAGLPPREGHDAPRGRGIGPRRARRDYGPPGGQGDYPGRRRTFGGRGTPQRPAPGSGPGDEPQADHEARERFSLPIRRGSAGQDRTGRFGRFGRGSAPEAPGGLAQPATTSDGGPYDSGGRPDGGYPGPGHPSGPYPSGSYEGGRSSGGAPGEGHARVPTRAVPMRAAGLRAVPPAGVTTRERIRAAPTRAVPIRAGGLRAVPPAGVTTRERIRAAPTRAVPIRAGGPRAAVRTGVLRVPPIRVVPMRAAGLRAVPPAGVTTTGRIRAALTRAVPIRAAGPRAGVLRAAPIPVVPMRVAGLRAAVPAAVTTTGRIRAVPIRAVPIRVAGPRTAAPTAAVSTVAATETKAVPVTAPGAAGPARHPIAAGAAVAGRRGTHGPGGPGHPGRPARDLPDRTSSRDAVARPTTTPCSRLCHRSRPACHGTASGTTRPRARTVCRATTREKLTGEERDSEPGHRGRGAARGHRRGCGPGRIEAHRDARRGSAAATATQRTGQHRCPRLPGPGPGRSTRLSGRAHRGPGHDGSRPRGGERDRRQHRRPTGQRHPARDRYGDRCACRPGGRARQDSARQDSARQASARQDAVSREHTIPGADQPGGGHRSRAGGRGHPGERGDGPGPGGRAGPARGKDLRALRRPGYRFLVRRPGGLLRRAHPAFPHERGQPARRRQCAGLHRRRAAAGQQGHGRGRGAARHGHPVPGEDAARHADGGLERPHQRRAGRGGG